MLVGRAEALLRAHAEISRDGVLRRLIAQDVRDGDLRRRRV